MILIDGREREEKDLDPTKHRFQGMFRFPYAAPINCTDMCCPACRRSLASYVSNIAATECWLAGHFDIPQYQTIGEGKT